MLSRKLLAVCVTDAVKTGPKVTSLTYAIVVFLKTPLGLKKKSCFEM